MGSDLDAVLVQHVVGVVGLVEGIFSSGADLVDFGVPLVMLGHVADHRPAPLAVHFGPSLSLGRDQRQYLGHDGRGTVRHFAGERMIQDHPDLSRRPPPRRRPAAHRAGRPGEAATACSSTRPVPAAPRPPAGGMIADTRRASIGARRKEKAGRLGAYPSRSAWPQRRRRGMPPGRSASANQPRSRKTDWQGSDFSRDCASIRPAPRPAVLSCLGRRDRLRHRPPPFRRRDSKGQPRITAAGLSR